MPHRSSEELRAEIEKLEAQLSEANRKVSHLQSDKAHHPYLQAVLDAVPIGVVLTDENGRIIHGNKWVEELVRHPVLHSESAEAYGEWVSFHEDGRRVQSSEYPLARVIREGEELSELDVHYQRGDGTRFWMRIIGRPILNEAGHRIGAAVALVDIDAERRLEHQKDVLIGELDHRVKNAFTVMKAIVRRSLERMDLDASEKKSLLDRLDAYAVAHAKLVGNDWDTAPLASLVRDSLGPFGTDRFRVTGQDIDIPSRSALALSMALHELGTNSVKHGALSNAQGTVAIDWTFTGKENNEPIELVWQERGGPKIAEPKEAGFGTFVIDQAVAAGTDGKVTMLFKPEGFIWKLTMPSVRT